MQIGLYISLRGLLHEHGETRNLSIYEYMNMMCSTRRSYKYRYIIYGLNLRTNRISISLHQRYHL
jgi:hypothetical protein